MLSNATCPSDRKDRNARSAGNPCMYTAANPTSPGTGAATIQNAEPMSKWWNNGMEKRIFFCTAERICAMRHLVRDRNRLNQTAQTIVKQYRKGSLPNVDMHQGWTLIWRDLIKILRNKCPGFSALEYGIALNMGFDHIREDTRLQ